MNKILKTGLELKAISDLDSMSKNIEELKLLEKRRLETEYYNRKEMEKKQEAQEQRQQQLSRDQEQFNQSLLEQQQQLAAEERYRLKRMEEAEEERFRTQNEETQRKLTLEGIKTIKDLNLGISVEHLKIVEDISIKNQILLAEAAALFRSKLIEKGLGFMLKIPVEGQSLEESEKIYNLDSKTLLELANFSINMAKGRSVHLRDLVKNYIEKKAAEKIRKEQEFQESLKIKEQERLQALLDKEEKERKEKEEQENLIKFNSIKDKYKKHFLEIYDIEKSWKEVEKKVQAHEEKEPKMQEAVLGASFIFSILFIPYLTWSLPFYLIIPSTILVPLFLVRFPRSIPFFSLIAIPYIFWSLSLYALTCLTLVVFGALAQVFAWRPLVVASPENNHKGLLENDMIFFISEGNHTHDKEGVYSGLDAQAAYKLNKNLIKIPPVDMNKFNRRQLVRLLMQPMEEVDAKDCMVLCERHGLEFILSLFHYSYTSIKNKPLLSEQARNILLELKGQARYNEFREEQEKIESEKKEIPEKKESTSEYKITNKDKRTAEKLASMSPAELDSLFRKSS